MAQVDGSFERVFEGLVSGRLHRNTGYKKWTPNKNTKPILDKILVVISEYEGEPMTIRQIFYQLVSRNVLLNNQKQVDRVSRIITNARESGKINWDSIVDRHREYSRHPEFTNTRDLLSAAVRSFRLPRWQDQDFYIEVIIEKDALAAIIEPTCDKYHIGLLVNKGFGSATVIHDVALRMRERESLGKKCVIFYLGDHDPSGLNMVEDITHRFKLYKANVSIQRLALYYEQALEYDLPKNIVKTKDTRSKEYVKKFGSYSWELDALPPGVIVELLEKAILEKINLDLYKKWEEREKAELAKLGSFP